MESSLGGEDESPPQELAINSGPGSPLHYSAGAPVEGNARETSPYGASDDYAPPPSRKGSRAARPCRVPGCSADVTGLKSYNWRYRICEEHRSAPSVVIDGMRVRFCQMCAKFHELAAFQGRKMSCQKKLDGHNARRRVGNRASGADGSRRSERVAERSSSGGSSSLSLGGMSSPGCGHMSHAALGLGADTQSLSAALEAAARQLAAAQAPPAPQWPGFQPAGPPAATPAQTPADMLISLLRMAAGPQAAPPGPPAPAAPPAMSLPMLEAQALLHTLEGIMAGQGVTFPPLGSAVPHVPGPGMAAPVAVRASGAAADGALDPILAAVLGASGPGPVSVPPSYPSGSGTVAPAGDASAPADAPTADAADLAADLAGAIEGTVKTEGAVEEKPEGSAPQEAIEAALKSEDGGAAAPPAPPVLPPAQLVRLSIKLFGCEPHQLEPSVHRELLTLVSADAEQLEAYVRPGCTAVTLDLRVPMPAGGSVPPAKPFLSQLDALTGALNQQGLGQGQGQSARQVQTSTGDAMSLASGASEATANPALLLPEDALQAVHALLDARMGEAGGSPTPFVVQVGGRVAVGVGSWAAAPAIVTGSSLGLAPTLLAPEPRAVVAGRDAAVTLRGHSIAAPTDLPLCRQRGSNVTLDVLGAGMEGCEGSGGLEWVSLRPLGLVPGCAELEVERGALLSEAVPLLVLPDIVEGEAAAAEVCAALARAPAAGAADGDRFIREVGWALQQLREAAHDGAAESRAAVLAAVAEARACPTLAALLRLHRAL